jgi:PAS domain S-box-containing protein
MNHSEKEILSGPLVWWDIYSEYMINESNYLKDKTFLKKFLGGMSFSKKEFIPEYLNEFDAIVITDIDRKIVWASHGFTAMTGYTVQESIGKKPSFLQGEKTDPEEIESIRRKLKDRKSVSAKLINYKKSGMAYSCEIHIEPVFDHNNNLAYFLAFEKETHTVR